MYSADNPLHALDDTGEGSLVKKIYQSSSATRTQETSTGVAIASGLIDLRQQQDKDPNDIVALLTLLEGIERNCGNAADAYPEEPTQDERKKHELLSSTAAIIASIINQVQSPIYQCMQELHDAIPEGNAQKSIAQALLTKAASSRCDTAVLLASYATSTMTLYDSVKHGIEFDGEAIFEDYLPEIREAASAGATTHTGAIQPLTGGSSDATSGYSNSDDEEAGLLK